MKKAHLYTLVGIAVLIIGGAIAYPMYARKACSDMADKYYSYMKNGEAYLSIDKPLNDGTDHISRTIIKRGEFNDICLQSKFGL